MITIQHFNEPSNNFDFFDYVIDFWRFTDPSVRPGGAIFTSPGTFTTGITVLEEATEAQIGFFGAFFLTETAGDVTGGELNGINAFEDGGTLAAQLSGANIDALTFIDAFDAAAFSNNLSGVSELFSEDILFIGVDTNESFTGFGGDDTFRGNGGRDTFNGSTGVDTADYSAELGGAGVSVNISGGNVRDTFGDRDTFVSIENVVGTFEDDTIFGNGAANVFTGGFGDDALNGKGGDDDIRGDQGNDVLVGGLGDDTIDGGEGDDVIGGRGGDDIITGGFGVDSVVGQVGDDDIDGGAGDDGLNGGVGFDTVRGGEGDDTLLGRSDDDLLFGDAGDDALNGGTGEDRLTGGAGDDQLIGGADGDTFVFTATLFGDDEVVRFQDGLDVFEVDTSVAASFAAVTVTQDGDDAVISFGGGTVTVLGRDAASITADDFSFV